MRVEVLSDHSQVLLDEVAVKHREASAHIAQGKTEEREAYAAERAARDRTPWWRRLSCVVSAEERREGLHARSVRVEIQAAQRRRIVLLGEEAKIKAGAAGEAALAVRLSKVLPDDWLMFQGYRGRRGEADLVVVGSLGIWVIEVKNLAVTLNAEGEDWRYVRARGGDAIEEPATDNSGRSWGRQAGDAARALRRMLENGLRHVPVRTAVVLVNPGARLGTIQNPGVDLVTTKAAELVDAILAGAPVVTLEAQHAVEELIRVDHERHNP